MAHTAGLASMRRQGVGPGLPLLEATTDDGPRPLVSCRARVASDCEMGMTVSLGERGKGDRGSSMVRCGLARQGKGRGQHDRSSSSGSS